MEKRTLLWFGSFWFALVCFGLLWFVSDIQYKNALMDIQ